MIVLLKAENLNKLGTLTIYFWILLEFFNKTIYTKKIKW